MGRLRKRFGNGQHLGEVGGLHRPDFDFGLHAPFDSARAAWAATSAPKISASERRR